MKNKLPLILVIILFIFGAWFVYSNQTNQSNLNSDTMVKTDSQAVEENTDESNEDKMDITDDKMEEEIDSNQSYVDYSLETYNNSSSKKRVLFFHAKWCPTCKAANTEFEKNLSKIPADVVILKTDYDTQKDLKNKHNITYQHTFVQVDENGEEITKWNGGDIDKLINNIQ